MNAILLLEKIIQFRKIDSKNTKIAFQFVDDYQPEMRLESLMNTQPYLGFKDVDMPKVRNSMA